MKMQRKWRRAWSRGKPSYMKICSGKLTSVQRTLVKRGTINKKLAKAAAIITLFNLLTINPVMADQIVTDGKTQTSINVSGNITDILTETVRGKTGFNSFKKFSVDKDNVVNLYLPNGTENLLNLVHLEKSYISGLLNSIKDEKIGGNVYFLNPYGFVVGKTGVMNVGSLTLMSPTKNYMDTFFTASGPSSEAVDMVMAGTVPISETGLIAVQGKIYASKDINIKAGNITNSGTIATGADFTCKSVDFSDVVNVNDMANGTKVAVTNGKIQIVAAGDVANSGKIVANGSDGINGGNITIKAGNNIAINDGSQISARGQGQNSAGGQVIVYANNDAEFNQGAVIDVRGGDKSGDGGFIEFSAKRTVNLNGGTFRTAARIGSKAGSVLVDPEDLNINTDQLAADDHSGDANWSSGSWNFTADNSITVAPGVIISSRRLADGSDQLTGRSIGDSGDISLTAPNITLGAGSMLLSFADSGYTGGDITLTADSSDHGAGPANAAAKIEINGATLKGRNITATVTADAGYNWDGSAGDIAQMAATEVGSSLLFGLTGVDVGVAMSSGTSELTVGADSVLQATGNGTTSGSVNLSANTQSSAESLKAGLGAFSANKLFNVGFVYGKTDANATVVVNSGATIKGDDLNITASNKAVLDVSVYGFSTSTEVNSAIAVTDANVTATAQIEAGANIEVKQNVVVRAYNESSFNTSALAMALEQGSVGVGAAVTTLNTNATASNAANLTTDGLQSATIDAVDKITKNTVSSGGTAGSSAVVGKTLVPVLKGVDSAVTKISNKLSSSPVNMDESTGVTSKPKLAAAITYTDNNHKSNASIAGHTQIDAAKDVVVSAVLEDALIRTHAISEVAGKANDPNNPGAKLDLSAAVVVGLFDHQAKAHIGEGAKISGQHVGVQSAVKIPYDITWAKWDGISTILSKLNGNLGVANGMLTGFANAQSATTGLGLAGAVSYINFTNTGTASIDRSAVITIKPGAVNTWTTTMTDGRLDYSSTLNWAAPVNIKTDIDIEGVYAAGNISLLLNGAGGDPGATSVGGAYSQVNYNNMAKAYIAEGVTVGQQDGEAAVDVAVEAANRSHLIAVAPSAGRGSSYGVNAIFSIANIDDVTEASVDDEAQITADNLLVRASEDVAAWSLAGAFTSSDSAGVGAGVAINNIGTDTNAFIGDNDINNATESDIDGSTMDLTTGQVSASEVAVAARTDGRIESIAVAGAMASSSDPSEKPGKISSGLQSAKDGLTNLAGKIPVLGSKLSSGSSSSTPPAQTSPKFGLGISGSAAVNLTELNTRAYTDGAKIILSPTGTTNLAISAVNDTDIGAISGSASLVRANNPSSSFSAGVAGSVAFNDMDNTTEAYLNSSTVSNAQDVGVSALSGGEQLAVAIGATVNASANQEKSASAAGSVSISIASNTTSARIEDNSVLTGQADGSDRTIDVIAYDRLRLGTGGGSLIAGGRAGIGAAVTYSEISNTVESIVAGSQISNYDNVNVQALTATKIGAGGGMAGVSWADNGGTFGGVFVYSDIGNTVQAKIEDSTVVATAKVDVSAADINKVDAYDTIIDSNDGGVPNTESLDYDGTEIGQTAGTGSSIISVAGVIQGGKNNLGVSFAYNKIHNNFTALIDNSAVSAGTAGEVNVIAQSQAIMFGAAVGVGIATDKFAGSGSLTLNEIDNNITAEITAGSAKTITASELTVQATDQSKIDSLAGSVTISTGNVAVGAAVGVNDIGNMAQAKISGVDIDVRTVTNVTAQNNSTIRTLSAAAGGSKDFAFNGSASASTITNTTEAAIQGAKADDNTNNVTVQATDDATIQSLSGAAAVSGSTAAGAAISVNQIDNTTSAYVSGSLAGSQYRLASLLVASDSDETISSLAVGIGGGVDVGVAGSVAVNLIENDTTAYIDGGAKIIAQNNTGVLAESNDKISLAAGTAGIGVSAAGVGASATVNTIGGTTEAYIAGTDTEVSALAQDSTKKLTVNTGELSGEVDLASGLDIDEYGRTDLAALRSTEQVTGLAVNATGTHSVENIVVNVAGGQYAGVAGTSNVNVISGTTQAYIDGAEINTASPDLAPSGRQVRITAGDHAYANNFVGSVAIGPLGAGVGASVDTGVFSRTTKAYVQNSSEFRAQDGAAVKAASSQGASSLVVSGSGGIVGVVGTGSVAKFTGTTEAYTKSSTAYTSDLSITADHDSKFFVAAGGVTVGGVAVAGTFSVGLDENITKAYIDNSSVNATGAVAVTAANSSEMDNWAVSGSGGGGAGVAGNATVSLINNTTQAYITGSTVAAEAEQANSLAVSATDQVTVANRAGAIGISFGGYGVGAGAAVTKVDDTTTAYIENSGVYTQQGTTIEALATRDLDTVAVSVGVGNTAGIGGTAAVTLVGQQLDGDITSELNKDDNGTLFNVDGLTGGNRLTGDNFSAGSNLSAEDLQAINYQSKFTVTTNLDSASLQSRTAALVSGNSNIQAGGNVKLSATEQDKASINAGAGGFGFTGIGGAVGVMNINNNVDALVMDTAQITTAGGKIEILAAAEKLSADDTAASVGSYQGSAGAVALGAAVAEVNVTNNVTAQAARGTTLRVDGGSGTLTVQATDNMDVTAQAQGYQAGVAAAGAVLAYADKDGDTTAAISDSEADQSTTTSINAANGQLTVKAQRSGKVNAKTIAGAGGVYAGSGSDAKAADDGHVAAKIGDDVNLAASQAAVVVDATATPQVKAEARGYNGSIYASVGVALAKATSTQDVRATIGTDGTISADTLDVKATVGLNGTKPAADSFAEAISGSLLLGVNATESTAQNTSTVTAAVNSDLTIGSGTSIVADNTTWQEAEVTGVVAGALAAGGNVANAASDTTTTAVLGDVNVTGGTLTVQATGTDDNYADSTSGSGGVVAGAAAKANISSDSNTTAQIGNGGSGKTLSVADLILTADHVTHFNAKSYSINAAVAGMSGSYSNNDIHSTVKARVGANNTINSSDVSITANDSVVQLGSGYNAKGGAGGVVNGSAVKSVTTVEETTNVDIGVNAELNVLGDPMNDPGNLILSAQNYLNVDDEAVLTTGGAVQGPYAESTLDADLYSNINVGNQATLRSAGKIAAGAYTDAYGANTSLVKTYGGVGFAGGHSVTDINANEHVNLGDNIYLMAYGNISLIAGQSADGWWLNNVTSNALTEVYNYTAAPLDTEPYANAESTHRSKITIGSGTLIDGVHNITLAAYDGDVTASGSGTGHNPYLELLGTESSDGHSSTSTYGTITMNGTAKAGIYHDQSVTISSNGTVTLGPTSQHIQWSNASFNPQSEIQTQIDNLNAQLAAAATDDEREQLQGQIDVLTMLKTSVAGGTVQAVSIGEVYAAGGNVIVSADSLAGNGILTAYGEPTITITNNSNKYLSLNKLFIPDEDTGGAVKFTGSGSRTQALMAGMTLNEIGTGLASRIEVSNTYDAGSGIGPAIFINEPINNLRGLVKIFNQSGSLGQFDEIRAQQVQIDIPNGTYTVNIPNGMWFANADPLTEWRSYEALPTTPDAAIAYVVNSQFNYNGQYSSTDALNNYLRDSTDPQRMYPPKSGGNTYVFYNMPNVYDTDSDGHGGDVKLFNGFWMRKVPVMSLSKTGSYANGIHSAGKGISAVQIGINAKYIDINGTIKAGRQGDQSIQLNAALDAWLNAKLAAYNASGGESIVEIPTTFGGAVLLQTADSGDKVIKASYDLANDRIILDDVNASGGGFVYLHGQIMSTNRLGSIEVLDGFGDVRINNLSSRPLVVQDIDTGHDTVGQVKIVDTGKHRTTWYVYRLGQGLAVYDNSNGAADYTTAHLISSSAGNSSSYQPLLGQRYEWTRTANLQRTMTMVDGDDPGFYRIRVSAWQWIIPDAAQPNNPWTTTTRVTTGNSTSLPYFKESISGSSWNYNSNNWWIDFVDSSKGVPTDAADGHDWHYTIRNRASITTVSSIKADNSFAVKFTGNDQGNVNINSAAGILLNGSISNTYGNTSLMANNAKIVPTTNGVIATENLNLTAGSGIGSAVLALQTVLDGGQLSALTTAGDVYITIPSGSVELVQLSSGSSTTNNGDIALTVDRDIIPAAGTDVHVRGSNVTVTSTNGTIGSAGNPLNIRAIAMETTSGAKTGGEVSLTAAGDIYLTQTAGDLRLVQAVSEQGDVGISVPTGQLINVVRQRTVDKDREAQLAAIWDKLYITEGQGEADALASTVTPYEQNVKRSYQEYWLLRQNGQQVDGTFSLKDAQAIEKYRARAAAGLGIDNPTDEQVQSYARGAYLDYTNYFVNLFGENWSTRTEFQSYQTDYTYTAPTDKVAELTYGAEWLSSQLVFEINQNALLPASDTQVWTQDPNISGRNVQVNAQGSIGSLNEPMVINLPTTAGETITLTSEQKAALAAASLPGDVTIIYADERPVQISILQTQPLFISATENINVTAGGNAFLQSALSFNVERLTAGGDIRLISSHDLINAAPAGQNAIVSGSDLALEAGTGSIGTADNPLKLSIGGVLGTARAADGIYILDEAGDLLFNQIYAGGLVQLNVTNGSILSQQIGQNIIAGDLIMEASGRIGSAVDGVMEIEVGADGNLRGTAGAEIVLASSGTSLRIGDLTAGTTLAVSGLNLNIEGDVVSHGQLQLTASNLLGAAEQATITSNGNHIGLSADTIALADGSLVDAATAVVDVLAENANQISKIKTTGNVNITANNGSITQTTNGGIIGAARLTTSSVGGQTLDGLFNSVSEVTAVNSDGGDISLTNTHQPLTVLAINQTNGGNVAVNNTGAIALTGIVDTTGEVSLTSTAAITETGIGKVINAAVLRTQSAGGQQLNGANTVNSLSAVNNGANIEFTNTASSLTILQARQQTSGDIIINNTGNIGVDSMAATQGDVRLIGSGSITNAASSVQSNINAVNINLTAGNMIGHPDKHLVIDSSNAAAGVLNAAAPNGIYITEFSGDLNIDRVQSVLGDVHLSADGSILNRNANDEVNLIGTNVVLSAEHGSIGEAGKRIVGTVSEKWNVQAYGDVIMEERNHDFSSDYVISDQGSVDLLIPNGRADIELVSAHQKLIIQALNGISLGQVNAGQLDLKVTEVGGELYIRQASVSDSVTVGADHIQFDSLIHTGDSPLLISAGGGSKDMADEVIIHPQSDVGIHFTHLAADVAQIDAQADELHFLEFILGSRADINNSKYTVVADNVQKRLFECNVQLYPQYAPFFLYMFGDQRMLTNAYIVNYDNNFILNEFSTENSIVRWDQKRPGLLPMQIFGPTVGFNYDTGAGRNVVYSLGVVGSQGAEGEDGQIIISE